MKDESTFIDVRKSKEDKPRHQGLYLFFSVILGILIVNAYWVLYSTIDATSPKAELGILGDDKKINPLDNRKKDTARGTEISDFRGKSPHSISKKLQKEFEDTIKDLNLVAKPSPEEDGRFKSWEKKEEFAGNHTKTGWPKSYAEKHYNNSKTIRTSSSEKRGQTSTVYEANSSQTSLIGSIISTISNFLGSSNPYQLLLTLLFIISPLLFYLLKKASSSSKSISEDLIYRFFILCLLIPLVIVGLPFAFILFIGIIMIRADSGHAPNLFDPGWIAAFYYLFSIWCGFSALFNTSTKKK